MKSTILLTTALFLASAPSPDTTSISEFSGGFLADTNAHELMAAELTSDKYTTAELSTLADTSSPPKFNPDVTYASLDPNPGTDKSD